MSETAKSSAPSAPSPPAELTDHPLAEIFPLMEAEEFNALVDDIKANGLREPITTFENKILDGRNRYRAVIKAGLQSRLKDEKDFRLYTGNDPVGFVISANVLRRHLNESQRALIAAKVVTIKLGDNQHKPGGISVEKVSELFSVSAASIAVAKDVVVKAAPEIIDDVKNGKLRLGRINKDVLTKPKDQQAAELERLKDERVAKAKANREAAKSNQPKASGPSKANQALVALDDFKKKWQSFNDMQRRSFVASFKDEIAELLDAVRLQEEMIGGGSPNLETQIISVQAH
jgi:ParB-like chromosome segregation protein Spo0J